MQRIQGKGTFVKKAKANSQKSKTLNIYVEDTHGLMEQDPFLSDILCGIHRACSKDGSYSVRMVAVPQGESMKDVFERSGNEYLDCDAIFASYLPDQKDCELLMMHGIKASSIGKPFDGCPIPFVEVDHYKGAFGAVERLAGLGHKSILLMERADRYPHVQRREQGFLDALPHFKCEGRIAKIDAFTQEAARKALDAEMEPGLKFSAVLCLGDRSTVGLFRGLRERGIKVPEDVSIISYSDFSWIDEACSIKFAKVRQSTQSLAEAAFTLLSSQGGEAKEIWLETFFEDGDTCKEVGR